jgi:hypothetical protein
MKTNYEFLREHAFPIVRAREVNQFVADAHTYLFREYYDVDRGWLTEDIREAALLLAECRRAAFAAVKAGEWVAAQEGEVHTYSESAA